MSQNPAKRIQFTEALSHGLIMTFRPDELHRVPTDDGSAIALGRYLPRGRRRFLEPVVLCHGLGGNRFNLDLDEHYSLARHLARRGFEAWVLELRGRGLAGPAREASFDLQSQFDVRAAIRTVLATGAKKLTWVGHSKGGMVMYGHLARNPEAPVVALVGIGTACSFAFQPGLKEFVRHVGPLLELGVIPTQRLMSKLARFGAPPGPITRYMVRAANVDPLVLKRAMANMTADVPGPVGKQFASWIRSGRFDGLDGFDYQANMNKLKLPILLIAGSQDLMAPAPAVGLAQKLVSGPVQLIQAGRDFGFRDDYGHGDLVYGRHAPDEIFPLVAGFLERESTPV